MGCYQSNTLAIMQRATNIMISSPATLNTTSILPSYYLFNIFNTSVILTVQKWIKLMERVFWHTPNLLNNPLPDPNSQLPDSQMYI